jgi:hypothetical protein
MSPSIVCGQEIHQILNRTERNNSIQQIHPLQFYECEILLTDSEPVGILYLLTGGELEYISPMVITKPPSRGFQDINRVTCPFWMPLFKNYDTWKTFGLNWYLSDLSNCKIRLRQILLWLSIQTVEKYRNIYSDMKHVGKMILGIEEGKEDLTKSKEDLTTSKI